MRSRLSVGWFLIINTLYAGDIPPLPLNDPAKCTVALSVAPVKHCHVGMQVQGWVSVTVLCIHCLMFLFRIRAVFFDQELVTAAFCVAWLAVLGTSLLNPFALGGAPLGKTGYCLDTAVKTYGFAEVLVTATYDAFVFLAITTKLSIYNEVDTTSSMKMFLTGKGMGTASRILLQSGQLYYLYVGFPHTMKLF